VAATVTFSSPARTVVTPTVLVADQLDALGETVAASLRSSGGTDFDAAFVEARRQLDAMPATVDRKAIVLLSDGNPNRAYTEDVPIAQAGIAIHTVGFGSSSSQALEGIAQRSGGTSAYAESVEEAQGALARAVARMRCEPVNDPEAVEVPPGGTRDVEFAVPEGTTSFTVLAVWGAGSVTAELVRADGSILRADTVLPGETFEQQANLARATAQSPAAGPWRVRLSAAGTNVETVRVSVELFGAPVLEHPLDQRPEPAAPGCQTEVRLFGRVAWSRCFEAVREGWRSRYPLRVGGLDVEPRGRGVVLERAGRLTGTGRLFVRTSGPALGSGELTLDDGALHLPLGGGRKLPLTGERKAGRVGGLPVVGDAGVELGWGTEGATLKLALGLGADVTPLVPTDGAVDPPSPRTLKRGFGLTVELTTTNEQGLAIGAIEGRLDAGSLYRSLGLQSLTLAYDPRHHLWTGGGVVVPFGGPLARHALPALTAEVGVTVNPLGFSRVRIVLSEINRPVGPWFLQRIGGEVARKEKGGFSVTGELGLSAGPTVEVPFIGDVAGLEVDGTATYAPSTVTASGALRLLGQTVANANAELDLSAASGSFVGDAGFLLGGRTGMRGRLDGWVRGGAFQLVGDVSLVLLGNEVAGGEGFVSSRGMGGCRRGLGPDYGWTAEFGAGMEGRLNVMTSSCDFGPLLVPARASQVGGAHAISFPRGRPGVLLRIRGVGGQPAVRLRRGRELIEVPAGAGFVETPRYTAIRDAASNDLWVVLNAPAGGRWQVEALPGSPGLEAIGRASARPRPTLRARVRRQGSAFVLRWRSTAIPGQTLHVVERGPGGLVRTIVRTTRSRGAVRFRPAAGRAGQRRIEATVLRSGLPRSVRVLRRLRVGTIRQAPPARVRVRRSGTRVTVRWRPVGRAVAHRVDVRLRDGRRLQEVVRPGRSVLRLEGVRHSTRGRVVVRSLSGSGVVGRGAGATLR